MLDQHEDSCYVFKTDDIFIFAPPFNSMFELVKKKVSHCFIYQRLVLRE